MYRDGWPTHRCSWFTEERMKKQTKNGIAKRDDLRQGKERCSSSGEVFPMHPPPPLHTHTHIRMSAAYLCHLERAVQTH